MALALVAASLAIFVGYVAATVRLLQVVSVIAMVARRPWPPSTSRFRPPALTGRRAMVRTRQAALRAESVGHGVSPAILRPDSMGMG